MCFDLTTMLKPINFLIIKNNVFLLQKGRKNYRKTKQNQQIPHTEIITVNTVEFFSPKFSVYVFLYLCVHVYL